MTAYDIFVYAIGFTAQLLFSWRMIEQWISSEKAKKTSIPKYFWLHSLMASMLLFLYGWLRDDFAIVLGQLITHYIYIRNLQIQGTWKSVPRLLRWFLPLLPAVVLFFTWNNNAMDVNRFFYNESIPVWLIIVGVVGQLVFTFRFVYQWLYSEKAKQSMLPGGFWWISLTGCILILFYAVLRKDPVLIAGQLSGFIVYTRNLMIIRKARFSQ